MIYLSGNQNIKFKKKVINISELKPLQIGKIVTEDGGYYDTIVMRSARIDEVEIVNISDPGPDRCWGWSKGKCKNTLMVRPMKGTANLTIGSYKAVNEIIDGDAIDQTVRKVKTQTDIHF